MKYLQELGKEQTLRGVAGTFGILKQFGPDFKLRFLFSPQLELSLLAHFQVEQPEIPDIPSVQKICLSDHLMQK